MSDRKLHPHPFLHHSIKQTECWEIVHHSKVTQAPTSLFFLVGPVALDSEDAPLQKKSACEYEVLLSNVLVERKEHEWSTEKLMWDGAEWNNGANV